jgi:hypothetical protein
MKKIIRLLLIYPVLFLLMGNGDSYPSTPEEVVAHYLKALQEYNFPEAHRYLTDEMTRGMDAFNWAVEQKQIYKIANVQINGYKIYKAVIENDKAYVPNILSSRDDMFNKQGLDEYELYLLINNNGYWEIDRQKLVDKKDREEKFKILVISR